MVPKESERDDTRSFLGEHGSTRILTYFLDEMSTRLKAVFARARRALLRTHSGEKPYKCPQCPYAAVTAGSVKNHMKTHSGESHLKASNAHMPLVTQEH